MFRKIHDRTTMKRSRDQLKSKHWRKTRAVWLKYNSLCVMCSVEGYHRVATEVDHVVPRRQGGKTVSSNLQSLCKSCHSRKTAKEMRFAMKEQR